jgi:pyruvate,water dikinase
VIVDLQNATAETCGPKAGSLGRLIRGGIPVPDGFVITGGSGGAELVRRLAAWGDPPVAVRSSAATEDTAGHSAAGQYDSFLGVCGAAAVAAKARACRESLGSPRAMAYRAAGTPTTLPTALPTAPPDLAVIVQRHVDADVAGVLVTGRPALVEASWGLGESVVGGLVTPDAWTVPGGFTAGDKGIRIDRGPGGVVRRAVPTDDRHRPCLTGADLDRLTALGDEVARLTGAPADIEWALAGRKLWVLQARPVTAPVPAGVAGSPGIATGPARLIHGPADFGRVDAGDIIVCRTTDPAWTPLLTVAAGVVTEVGGVLSHAAIVARERRIPAVLGVPGALTTLRDGRPVTIDGGTGTVHQAPD